MGIIEDAYNKSPIFIQTLFLNAKAIELYFERYGKKFWILFEEFEKNQWYSLSDLTEYQNEKLRALIKHAYHTVPYYTELMKKLNLHPDDIKTVNDLYKLPLLTKQDIKNNFNKLISLKFNKHFLRHGHTSGTTGSPLDLVYDIQTCVVHHVADWRQKNWAGLKYGGPFASVQGRLIVPIKQSSPPFWRKNHINNQLFMSSFHLREDTIPYYFNKIKMDGIKYIEGYPSTIYILAMYLNKRNQTFPLNAVLTSSETLYEFQRASIEKAFCCKVFDYYGMAERAVFATECEYHQGNHLNMDYGITEFVNNQNEIVSEGEFGRIVATSLHNWAMPLIRYQTNDSSSCDYSTCQCGRGFPLMKNVTTKDESIVTLPDGRLISPSVLTHPFKPMVNILESQIIQENKNEFIIKIVKNEKYSQTDEDKLLSAFKERLGKDLIFKFEYVDEIPRTKNGKLKWVISKIKPVF